MSPTNYLALPPISLDGRAVNGCGPKPTPLGACLEISEARTSLFRRRLDELGGSLLTDPHEQGLRQRLENVPFSEE
jgi:hypothetical protein